MNITAELTHEITADFTNLFGQRVVVIDCPYNVTTFAIVDQSTCTCGIRIF